MGRKLPARTARAAPLLLTGTLSPLLGTAPTDAADDTSGAIPLAQLSMVRVWGLYTRDGGSSTGTVRYALELSADPDTTAPASVSNWQPVTMLDGATYAAGAIDAWPYAPAAQPTDAGPVTRASPPLDTRAAQWARVLVADVDGTNPGQLEAVQIAGET